MNTVRMVFEFIDTHPLFRIIKGGKKRFILWQIKTRMLGIKKQKITWVNNSNLVITKGRPTSTANMYVGMSDFEEMGFLCHFLRRDDLFGDIGANLGIYTVLSAKAIGTRTISVEPEESTIKLLEENIAENGIGNNVVIKKVAVGSAKGTANFTTGLDAINHIAGGMEDVTTSLVHIDTIDNIFQKETPVFLKIDIEGYETEAINGALNILEDAKLKGILIELNGLAKRYGYSDIDIHNRLLTYGFEPFQYNPFKRILTKIDYCDHIANYIYLRDLDFVIDRIQNAEPFSIWGRKF